MREPGQHAAVWRRAAILGLLCIVLAAVAASAGLHAALIDVLTVAQEVITRHPLLGPALFVVFAAITAMFAFVSTAVIVPAAVFTWGEPLSLLLLWVGWMLGGICTYGIGRFLGRPVIRWLSAGGTLHRFEKRIRRDAPFGLVLLFQLALPSEITGYVLGLVRYRFSRYLLALALAELPYTAATVYLGASFVERRSTAILVMGIALVTLSVAAFYILRRRLSAPHAPPGSTDRPHA